MAFGIKTPPDIVFRYSEIALKGKNIAFYEKILINNIYASAQNAGIDKNKFLIEISQKQGKIYVREGDISVVNQLCNVLQYVSGIAWFGRYQVMEGVNVNSSLESVAESVLKTIIDDKIETPAKIVFDVRRYDKRYGFTSFDLQKTLIKKVNQLEKGCLKNLNTLEVVVILETNWAGVIKKQKGLAGIPVSATGKGIVLFSGGIDSPVAAFLAALRGINFDLLHFHPPDVDIKTSKIYELYKVIKKFNPYVRLFTSTVPELGALVQKGKVYNPIVVYRRMILKVAYQLGKKLFKYKPFALITGDSLGQVASQTLSNLIATNHVTRDFTNAIVLRPLIGLNKETITDMAKYIGTYQYSILEHKDCCTILNKNSKTETNLERLLENEKDINADAIVSAAVGRIQQIK